MKNKSALAVGFAGILSVAAFTAVIATPSTAEARIVCRDGARWEHSRCVEVRHAPRYEIGGYIPRWVSYEPLPRHHYQRYGRVPRGYSFVSTNRGEVIMLDRRHRIVRVYH
jgi:hypothetical protein